MSQYHTSTNTHNSYHINQHEIIPEMKNINNIIDCIKQLLSETNAYIQESNTITQNFIKLKQSFESKKSTILELISKASVYTSTDSVLSQILYLISNNIDTINNLIAGGVEYQRTVASLRLENAQLQLELNLVLTELKSKLSISDQVVLNGYLNQYKYEHNKQLNATEQTHIKEKQQMVQTHAQTEAELKGKLDNLILELQNLEKKFHAENEEQQKSIVILQHELTQLDQNSIKLSGALAAIGITTVSAVIGQTIIPIPILGGLVGGAVGSGISYITYNATDGNCSIQ